MELKDLVGLHVLTEVDFERIKAPHWYDGFYANQVNFVLDGVTYSAIEDPEDGYRSCMQEIVISNANVTNIFPPCKVFGKMNTSNYSQVNNYIEFYDTETIEIVLEIGTGNTNDYYPYFVGEFHPEAMAINKRVKANGTT